MDQKLRKAILPGVIILFVIGIAITSAIANRQYWLISIVFVALTLVPFFVRYEFKEIKVREMMLMVMIFAIAAISRVPFAAIPSVMPMTFIIIVSACVLGAERGFIIGALSAFVSNLFLGQGPWTPWQMLCWGLIGLFAGLLKDTWWMKTLWGKACFGFVAGLMFGWIMNLSSVIMIMAVFNWRALWITYAASIIFDLLHAVSNVLFILLFAKAWIRILERFKRKYGIR